MSLLSLLSNGLNHTPKLKNDRPVWRIEHHRTGIGMFQEGYMRAACEQLGVGYDATQNLPCPETDPLLKNFWAKEWHSTHNWYFGCEKKKDIQFWLFNNPLVAEKLDEFGFVLSEYRSDKIRYGTNQLIFMKKFSVLTSRTKCSEVFN